jgi:carbamoyl-phosphate synthase small subunit
MKWGFKMKGYLAMEDGTVLEGKVFGAKGQTVGEVVFNTSMTGYQEILTDPSYCGQIITMTYPLIGNYGTNSEDLESKRPYCKGFIVKEFCNEPSNWRNESNIEAYLEKHGVMGISGIDTRYLTRKIRNFGTLRGIITTNPLTSEEAIAYLKQVDNITGPHLVQEVTTPETYEVPVLDITKLDQSYKVVVIDFGAKENILRSLNHLGCHLHVVPSSTTTEEILAMNPDGIMLSNGPGDPTDVPEAIKTVSELIGKKPIFGICLGHQIIGLAVGAKTYKLKFGHRGANHPVKDLATGRVYITSQNHGYSIQEESLANLDITVTHRNLNDGTVEGIKHNSLPLFSVQYHPEAAPGPEDSAYLFDQFISLMAGNR